MLKPRNYVKIYVGQPEDSVLDYLCMDLVVGGRCIPQWSSTDPISEIGEEEFLKNLEDVLNLSRLYTVNLCIPLILDENIQEVSEDFDETVAINIRKLLKEVLS
jgi:hypothetical protein